MKRPAYYILLFAGVLLMAFFGSEITTTIAPLKSRLGHFLLPGYSVGLIMISAAMYTRLSSQMRDLRSKDEKIESTQS
ncbi:MAG TPA: hypothetical protein VLT36_22770 [Candidatus Dormibacteraeota bacterium]|nr:hypothetical protein [Candidatus Dormibacteraeota bacterium]